MDRDVTEVHKQAALLFPASWADKSRAVIGYSKGQDIWVIDQVWGQDGWMLAKFFTACLWTETELAKTRTRPISNPLDRTSLVNKGFITGYAFRANFYCGTRRVVPSRQDSPILPARVANHSAGFDSSCPLGSTRRVPHGKFPWKQCNEFLLTNFSRLKWLDIDLPEYWSLLVFITHPLIFARSHWLLYVTCWTVITQ